MRTFAIDFVRQLIEQTLHEQHILNKKYFGGLNQVNLLSFYEPLARDEDVDRFVETFRDLTEQQNRTGLIMIGVILAPENPTITNINSATIVPMTFTCSFRVKVEDRDDALETLNNMVDILKGRKHDIALFENGKTFKVGTIANNVNGTPLIRNGDYIGSFALRPNQTLNDKISSLISALDSKGVYLDAGYPKYLYYGNETLSGTYLKVAYKESMVDTWHEILDDETKSILFPETSSFTKWKLSMSFESNRCDEPRTLNGEDYCTISFGGSATLCNASILLGNQMTKVGISKLKVLKETNVDISGNPYWLEPLEMPSGNAANTIPVQLVSNQFVSNSHTDSIAISNQYSFIIDSDNELLMQFFKYGRYGIQGTPTDSYASGVTPNMIFTISEIWSCWGVVDKYSYNAKIVESIDIENTESDVVSITIPFQKQGDNN